jgi:hypothetical protein
MSLPNSLALRATHSHQGGRGGRPGGGLGSSVDTHHSPSLGKCSTGILHVASGATTQQGRGAGAVSFMAYSTPAWSLMFRYFVAASQGHLVTSLSQSQSTLAARRKGDSHSLKGNIAKKKRGKSDTNNGSPQKGNAAKKKRGKLDTRYETVEKRSANTDNKDDAKYNDEEDDLPIGGVPFGMKQRIERRLADFNTATVVVVRRGKNDTKDEAEYDDKEEVLPVTDAPFGVRQQGKRHLAEFNTATVVVAHQLKFMQRAFPPQPANVGKK